MALEQRLRLVQGGVPRIENRASERRRVSMPGQIVWKDAKGTTRMAPVVTRDVSEHGVAFECQIGAAIPLYRLVYFQIDRDVRHSAELPPALRKSNVLSAIFRVGESSAVTGAPTEYALRLLVEPQSGAARAADAAWAAGASTRTA
jgi:hypothetical protein